MPLVSVVPNMQIPNFLPCDACMKAKSTRQARPGTCMHQIEVGPLGLVHSDVKGPMDEPSFGDSRYVITLYDDVSSLSLIRFTKRRSEVFRPVKEMVVELETATSRKVNRFRSEISKEYQCQELRACFKEKGVAEEPTARYSPESNGKAERINRSLFDIARTILTNIKHIPEYKHLWAEAEKTADYLCNRMYTSARKYHDKTPFEVIIESKLSLKQLRTFGSLGHVHKLKQKNRSNSEIAP